MKFPLILFFTFIYSNVYSQHPDVAFITNESEIRNYFDKNEPENIEGIWEYSGEGGSRYKLAIFKQDFKFIATIIESNLRKWEIGDIKAVFEPAAVEEILTIKWIMSNKTSTKSVVGKVSNNALIEFNLEGKVTLYKVYPKLVNKKEVVDATKTKGVWAGNGSGLIISKSGYIVTNYHVIEDASEIEIEINDGNEIKKYNTEVIQVDKVNDLAILKIFDINFDGLSRIDYNFNYRSSDVGTQVYAYGYPMALSIMGKEIKVTDGIISSNSGFDGDITTYQITAPIQPGNSGGPLFDSAGNFIGINSSGLNKNIADNVGYTIKSSYVVNLLDVLPNPIELPNSKLLEGLSLTDQIKKISKYVVLIKVMY